MHYENHISLRLWGADWLPGITLNHFTVLINSKFSFVFYHCGYLRFATIIDCSAYHLPTENNIGPSFWFHCSKAQEATSCLFSASEDRLYFNLNCPTFRPLKCWRWLFSGWSLTAWRCFWCSSPRERWSSSTGHPGSRLCSTSTYLSGWTGWCLFWLHSSESLPGAPEAEDKDITPSECMELPLNGDGYMKLLWYWVTATKSMSETHFF